MTERPTVAIFAGSRTPKDQTTIDMVAGLGTALGKAGFDINYGGGTEGLMGVVAVHAAKAGAGINAMVLACYAHETQVEGARQIPIETEQERFSLLSTHNAPVAMIMLPGGPGSLREAIQGVEVALGGRGKPPVFFVSDGGYMNGIRQFFEQAAEGGFISKMYGEKILRFLKAEEVVEGLQAVIARKTENDTPKPPQTSGNSNNTP